MTQRRREKYRLEIRAASEPLPLFASASSGSPPNEEEKVRAPVAVAKISEVIIQRLSLILLMKAAKMRVKKSCVV